MNVVLLSDVSADRVIGGAERVLRHQALGLRERGYRVSLLTRASADDSRPIVAIGDIAEHRYQISRTSKLAFVTSSIRESVQAYDDVCDGTTQDIVIIHQSLSGLGPILRRRNQARYWVYMCLSLAHEEYLTRTPAPQTASERLLRELNARARLWIERMVMQRCTLVIVLSEFMWKRVADIHKIPDSKIRLIPGAADPRQFRPPRDREETRRELKLPRNKRILFTVRNLVPRMGLENLIQAIAELRNVQSDLLLLIGGKGSLRPNLEAQIQQLSLHEYVRLLGFVPESELSKYYQAADLVLMPTLQLEGFGLVTVEALACGTPVLGTPVAALPEVLARVDPMLIAHGTDGAALAKAIGQVLQRFRDRPGEQARLSRKGRTLVEQVYNWHRHCEELDEIVREVCPPTYEREVA